MGAVMAEMMGKAEGVSRGRGGSMHLFDAKTRFYGGNAIVGGGLPVAVGLALELVGHARKRLGAAIAPKEIAFLAQLPRTRSGKIMRRLLKARELGLPEGDTSTLEEAA